MTQERNTEQKALRLSIVVPVYNVKEYLPACMESLLGQAEGRPVEILLVDDGSTDGSGQLCQEYQEKSAAVQVYHQANQGLSGARNSGLRYAGGEYVMFVDSDDWLEKDALELLLEELKQEKDIYLINVNRYQEGERTGSTEYKKAALSQGTDIFLKNLIAKNEMCAMAQTLVFKRSLLQKKNLLFHVGILHEDMEWTPRLLCLADSISVVERPIYGYRLGRPGAITSSSNLHRRQEDSLAVSRTLMQESQTYGSVREQFLKRAAALSLFMAMQYAAQNGQQEAVQAEKQIRSEPLLRQAIRYLPRKYRLCNLLGGGLAKGMELFNRYFGEKKKAADHTGRPRVCIVLVGKLPVPATMGGAVETLVQRLVEENEKTPLLDLTVLSVKEERAQRQAAEYRQTRFVWFGRYPLWNKFWWRVRVLIKKLSGKEICFPYQRQIAYRWLKKHGAEYDCFVAESELEIFIGSGIPARKILYHLHWAGNPTPARDSAFGTLVAVSRYVGEKWCRQMSRPLESLQVLPNCADLGNFSRRLTEEERKELRQKYGFGQDCFAILFAGRLVPEKGVRELIRAVNLLEPDRKVGLLVIGGTNFALSERTGYHQEIQQLAQASRVPVVFTGFVPNQELWRYYSAADLMACPAQWEEAAGIVNIEAMASGLPVIATRVAGVPEYLSDQCGYFIEWDEHLVENLAGGIAKLMDDPEKLAEMSKAGPQQAAAFSPEVYYQNFVDIITKAVKIEL